MISRHNNDARHVLRHITVILLRSILLGYIALRSVILHCIIPYFAVLCKNKIRDLNWYSTLTYHAVWAHMGSYQFHLSYIVPFPIRPYQAIPCVNWHALMQYRIVLFDAVMCWGVVCHVGLHCMVFCCIVLWGTIYHMMPYAVVRHDLISHDVVLIAFLLHCMTWHGKHSYSISRYMMLQLV